MNFAGEIRNEIRIGSVHDRLHDGGAPNEQEIVDEALCGMTVEVLKTMAHGSISAPITVMRAGLNKNICA